jgi:PPOX class probable F420-dependent enzyme
VADTVHPEGDSLVAPLTDRQLAFIRDNPFVGVVTTLRADGSPHSTVVWVEADETGVSFNTTRGSAKDAHLQSDPRVSVAVVDPADPFRWLSVSGTGTLDDEGANAQIDRLAQKYIGADAYPWHREGVTRVTVRIAVEKVGSVGIDG